MQACLLHCYQAPGLHADHLWCVPHSGLRVTSRSQDLPACCVCHADDQPHAPICSLACCWLSLIWTDGAPQMAAGVDEALLAGVEAEATRRMQAAVAPPADSPHQQDILRLGLGRLVAEVQHWSWPLITDDAGLPCVS